MTYVSGKSAPKLCASEIRAFRAKSGENEFGIRFQITLERCPLPETRHKFEGKILPLEGAVGRMNTPYVRGHFDSKKLELHVEAIDKGGIVGGQGFARTIFLDMRSLAPEAKTIYLANICRSGTRKLVSEALLDTAPAKLDEVSSQCPLIKSLLRSGFCNIEPVREGNTDCFGLRASLP